LRTVPNRGVFTGAATPQIDEFYGIPPAVTWDAFLMIPQGRQTKTLDIPLDKGPQIVEAKRGEPLKAVKPIKSLLGPSGITSAAAQYARSPLMR
jgi:hypothetical protein